MLEVTQVWLNFGGLIHQDFLFLHPDFYSGIREIYSGMSPRNQDRLYEIFLEINNGDYSTRFKLEFWEKSGADVYVLGDQICNWYSEILSMFEEIRN